LNLLPGRKERATARIPRATVLPENRNLLPEKDLPESMASPALSNLPILGESGVVPPEAPKEEKEGEVAPPDGKAPAVAAAVAPGDRTLEGGASEDARVGGRVTSPGEVREILNRTVLEEHAVDLVLLHFSTGDDLFRQGKFEEAEETYASALEYLGAPSAKALRAELQLRRGVALAESARPGALGREARGNLPRALELLREARRAWETAKDRERVALADTNLGICLGYAADLETEGPARAGLAREALEAFQSAAKSADGREKDLRYGYYERNIGLAYRRLARAEGAPEVSAKAELTHLEAAEALYEKRGSVGAWADTASLLAQARLEQAGLETEPGRRGMLLKDAVELQRRVIRETAKRGLERERDRAREELGRMLMAVTSKPELLALYPGAAGEAVNLLGGAAEDGAMSPEGRRNLAMAAMRAAEAEPDAARKDEFLKAAVEALRAAREDGAVRRDPRLATALQFQLGEALGARALIAPPGERASLMQQCLGAYTVAQEGVSRSGGEENWAVIEVAKARQLLRYAGHTGGEAREAAINRARDLLEASQPVWMGHFELLEQAECFRMLAQAVIAQNILARDPDLKAAGSDLGKVSGQLLALLRTGRALGQSEGLEAVVFAALEQVEDFAYRYEGTRSAPLLRMVTEVWEGLAEASLAGLKEGAPPPEGRLREVAVVRESLGTAYYHLGFFSAEAGAVEDLGRAAEHLAEAEAAWQKAAGVAPAERLGALMPVWLQQSSVATELARRALGPLRQKHLEVALERVETALKAGGRGIDDAVWADYERQCLVARSAAERELALMLGTPEVLERLGATRDRLEALREGIDREAQALAWVEVTGAVGSIYTVQGRLAPAQKEKRRLLARGVARHHQVLQEKENSLAPEQLRDTRLALAEALVLLGPLEKTANAGEILNFSVSTFREAAEALDSGDFPLPTAQARAGWAQAMARQARLLPEAERADKLAQARTLVLEALATLGPRNLPIPYFEALCLQAQLTPGEAGVSALRAVTAGTSARIYPELWGRASTQLQDTLLNGVFRPGDAYVVGQERLREEPGNGAARVRQLQCLYAAGMSERLLTEAVGLDGLAPEDLVLVALLKGDMAVARSEAEKLVEIPTEERPSLAGVRRRAAELGRGDLVKVFAGLEAGDWPGVKGALEGMSQ
jgi:tetratricopeptide (TPR) repeat protein